MASNEMGRRFARKSRHEVNSAAGNKSGGRQNRKTSSGLSRYFWKPGNPAKQQAADDEQDRIGNEDFARQHGQKGYRQQKPNKDFSNAGHVASTRLRTRACTARLLAKGNNKLAKKYLTAETFARAGSAWQAVWVKSTLRV